MFIALYKDGRYSKEKVVDGHLVNYDNSEEKFVEIRHIWSKTWYDMWLTEDLLKSFNIPNLGYIKTNSGFEVYDITKEEYIEEELPIYVDVLGDIKKSKKSTILKTPTKESVEASKAIYQKIKQEFDKIRSKNELELVRNLIEEGNGIAYINTRTTYIYDLYNILYLEGIKVLFSSNGNVVIGTVAKNPILELYVPEFLIPKIIGKGGGNIKKMATEVEAKRINVKAI